MEKTKNVIELLKGLVPDNIYESLKDKELDIDIFDMNQLITEAKDFNLSKDILCSYNIDYEILPKIKDFVDKPNWFSKLSTIIEDTSSTLENGFDIDELSFITENLVPVCGLLNDVIRLIIVIFFCIWAIYSSGDYLKVITTQEQRYLVLSPCILFYVYISWFVFATKL